jgi:hypothetical protein
VGHVALDTPAYTRSAVTSPHRSTTGLVLFGPLRSVQLAGQLAASTVGAVASSVDRGLARTPFGSADEEESDGAVAEDAGVEP